MNRTELIGRVSDASGLSRRDVEAAFEHTIYAITSAVRGGEDVRLTGFGTFRLRERPARMGRNPRTGASLRVKASKSMAFSPGATLKTQLNSRGAPPKPSSMTATAKATTAKAPAKRAAAAPARKTAAKKTPAKSTASKVAAKKAPAKKAPARKAPAKKAPAKKAPARKR